MQKQQKKAESFEFKSLLTSCFLVEASENAIPSLQIIQYSKAYDVLVEVELGLNHFTAIYKECLSPPSCVYEVISFSILFYLPAPNLAQYTNNSA